MRREDLMYCGFSVERPGQDQNHVGMKGQGAVWSVHLTPSDKRSTAMCSLVLGRSQHFAENLALFGRSENLRPGDKASPRTISSSPCFQTPCSLPEASTASSRRIPLGVTSIVFFSVQTHPPCRPLRLPLSSVDEGDLAKMHHHLLRSSPATLATPRTPRANLTCHSATTALADAFVPTTTRTQRLLPCATSTTSTTVEARNLIAPSHRRLQAKRERELSQELPNSPQILLLRC
jgi:hypothetical protein